MSPPEPINVRSGCVILQRLIDVADAIDLEQVRAGLAAEVRLAQGGATSAGLATLPLTLGSIGGLAGELRIEGRATVRLYDFGVAALTVACDMAHKEWDELVALVDALAPASPLPDPCTETWRILTQRLLEATGLELRHGDEEPLAEQHVVIAVDAFEPPTEARALRQRLDIPRLLSGDARPLSDTTRARLLRHCFSYHADDLVAVGRQRSFVYRSASMPSVLEVLEAAHARLLELRYYDALLDGELPRMYALVARTHGRFSLLAPRRMANLARRLYTLVAEVTELTEKIDADMQLVGRTHLTRVYAAALELLQVAALDQAVDRKLAMVRDTYAALYDEAAASRAGLLEWIIIALISLEIMLALVAR